MQIVKREFWLQRIYDAWNRVPIVWLTGVRRAGKITIAKQIESSHYLNCDLPSVQRILEEPERLLRSISASTIIFDEIHQLDNPSQILKICADEYAHIKVLATGSSTLAATKKFRDSLTGRKRHIQLLPVLYTESDLFATQDIRKRIFRGGLPETLLTEKTDNEFYAEWLDSYYARDIQELFRVGQRRGFLTLLELLMRNSGGQLEVSSLAKLTGLSRPTTNQYIDILHITHAITLLRPFHGGSRQELVRQNKVYAFDTGFIRFARGWNEVRPEDCGKLWENMVLDILKVCYQSRDIFYWRDKQGHEIDFVIRKTDQCIDCLECKWQADHFEARNLAIFRNVYPQGSNFVISPQIEDVYSRGYGKYEVCFCNPDQFMTLCNT